MFDQDQEDLKAFEARLASLRPRSIDLPSPFERGDDRLLSPLARANGGEGDSLPSPSGRGAGGEGSDHLLEPALTLALSQRERGPERLALSQGDRGQERPAVALATSRRERGHRCDNPAGHRFLCVHCGMEATLENRSRWAWPAAVASLTAIAATLLVMLVAASHPQLVVQRQTPPAAAPEVVQQPVATTSSDADDASRDGLASSGRDSSGDGETYLALRNQSLRNGVVSWKSPAPSSAMTNGATSKAPLTYREQLGRLLKETEQQGWHAL